MGNNKFDNLTSGLDINNLSNVNKLGDVKKPIKTEDFASGSISRIKQSVANSQDYNEYGKIGVYDSSPSGPTFKARYKAYGQETYNKIGFDPNIDNETVYNQNTNTFDDMKRWATHSAMPMLGLGFISPINSYASALGSGDVGASTQEAKDYEYYNAIGYSSKGGLGGLATNLFNSVSYSAGILLEGVAEGMLIGGAVGAVAGEGIGAIPGSIIGGAVKGLEAFTKIPRALYQSVSTLGKIGTAVKELKNINNAKNFFVTVGKGTGKFLNPLENTVDAYKSLKQVDDISRLAKSAKTVGAFWHDIMGINMALSEGRLEGGFTEQNIYNKLYNEHYSKYSKAPSIEEQEKMKMISKKGGFSNTLWNTGLVFYSNKIAFPSITRASFLKGVPRFNFGRVVGEVGKEFQLVFNPADDVAKSYYSKEAISLKNSIKALKDPKKLGAGALNYFKKNLVEGFQEVSQEAMAMASEKYYTEKYHNPSATGFMYGFGALLDGIDKQVSSQGAEVFASGFLMGGLLQGPSKLFKFGTKNFSRIFKDKALNKLYVDQKEAQADNIVNALNNMHKNAKYFFDPRMSNYSTQMLIAKAVDNPDNITKKESKDLEFEGFQSSVLTALRTGTFDMFIKNIGDYKTLSAEELEEAWSLEPGQGQKALENIDKSIDSAKITEARFNYARDKFKDFIELSNYKEGSPEHQAAQIYNQAYLESINSFVFLQNSFDNGLNRIQKLYGSANKIKSLSTSAFSNFSILSDSGKLSAQISYLSEEIDSAVSTNDPKLAEEITRKRTLLNALNTFHTAQENITGENLMQVLNNIQENGNVNDSRVTDYLNSFQTLLEAIAINNKDDGSFDDIDQVKVKLRAELDNNGGIDSLFGDLFDIHLLRHENSSMAKYVNMLADPQGFYDHLNNNFTWMKNLYNNRKEYYKEIINKEISDVEKNEILNTLASEGIFVDLDEFAEWCNNPDYLPSYFIDTTQEMIINQDSILYERYANFFIQAAQVIEKKAINDPSTLQQKYDDRLTELKEQKSTEVNKANEDFEQAFKDETGVLLQDAYTQNQEAYNKNTQLEKDQKIASEKITKLQSLLEIIGKDPVDSVKIVKLSEELLTPEEIAVLPEEMNEDLVDAIMNRDFKKADEKIMYKAVDIIYALTEKSPTLLAQKIEEQNNILKQNPVEILDIAETKAYKVNQERLDAINTRYDKFETDLETEFKEKGIDRVTQEDFTAQMGYDNYPQDLQNLVDESFNAFLESENIDSASLQNTDSTKYYNYRQNWLESSNGATLLNEYNKKIKEEGEARAKALKEPPVLTFRILKNLKIESNIPINNLNVIIDKLETAVKTKIYTIYKNGAVDKEIKLTEQDIIELTEDINKLKTFLQYKQGLLQPVSLAEQVLNNFRKNVQSRQDELKDVFDEDGNKIGRKFAGDPDTKLTTRATSISDNIASKIPNVKKPGYDEKNIDDIVNTFFSEYNKAIKKGDSNAFDNAWKVFTEYARTNKFQFNNEEKQARIRESLEKDTTPENFKKLINKEAFSNNAQAGTNLDVTIRRFFTIDANTGNWASFKYSDTVDIDGKETKISDIMSETAFNQMFGKEGVVTRFRISLDENGYVPLTNNVKLFDKNLLENGVSGETDMVLINGKGEIMIVDIKTSISWNGFNNTNSWKNVAYRAQLSIYRNLYYNMTGITPKIALFPLRVMLEKNGSSYVNEVTVGGEKNKDTPLIPLVPNTAKLFNTLELEYLSDVEAEGITLNKPEEPTQTETTTDIEAKKASIERRRQEELISLLPQNKISKGSLDFSAAFNIGIPEFYQQMFDMVKEGKDSIAGVKEKNAPLLQKLYNEGKLKDKKDVWLALNPKAAKINAQYDAELARELYKEMLAGKKVTDMTVAEQKVVNQFITEELRASVNAELAALNKSTVKPSTKINASDTTKVLLKDNVDKQVIYNGKLGTLVLQDDGSYGIEIDLSNEVELNNQLIGNDKTGLIADLALAKGEFGDPKLAKEIEKKIKDLQESQKGKETYPLIIEGKNVTDGSIELASAGVSLIIPIENIGQVSIIKGMVIDAKFVNSNENIAIVNGIRYIVGRNNLGEITELIYFKNDDKREEIDKTILALSNRIKEERVRMKSAPKQIEDIYDEIAILEKQKNNTSKFKEISFKIRKLKEKITSLSPKSFIRRIGKAEDKIKELQEERNKLSINDKLFLLGGNNNDVIFALNRLPNQFQKNRASKTAADTKKELKQIAALSDASPTVEKEIERILDDENFPEELNILFAKGILEFKGRGKELAKIKNWIDEKIQKLKLYENLLKVVENDALGAASVNRQINALKNLLNDLNLINLTAKNRIAKEQPYEKELSEIFGPESEVQSGTSVPEIQSPTGGQTKNVPGETGRGETQEIPISELKKIVNTSNNNLDNLVIKESGVNKATEIFAEITDLKTLQLKKLELLANRKSNKLTLPEINTAFENRNLELIKNVDIASLKVGDILQDITNFTNQDLPVQVLKINKDFVTLKYGNVTQDVTEDELVNNFVKPNNETVMPETVKPSQETVDASEQTKTDASENLNNKDFREKSEKEADDSSKDDLFKNLEDNSKTCL